MTSIKICPSCAREIAISETTCYHCGAELHYHMYEIVPEGSRYAIAADGEIRIHRLKLQRAREIISALNSTHRKSSR